jgi:hypothetical protein
MKLLFDVAVAKIFAPFSGPKIKIAGQKQILSLFLLLHPQISPGEIRIPVSYRAQ